MEGVEVTPRFVDKPASLHTSSTLAETPRAVSAGGMGVLAYVRENATTVAACAIGVIIVCVIIYIIYSKYSRADTAADTAPGQPAATATGTAADAAPVQSQPQKTRAELAQMLAMSRGAQAQREIASESLPVIEPTEDSPSAQLASQPAPLFVNGELVDNVNSTISGANPIPPAMQNIPSTGNDTVDSIVYDVTSEVPDTTNAPGDQEQTAQTVVDNPSFEVNEYSAVPPSVYATTPIGGYAFSPTGVNLSAAGVPVPSAVPQTLPSDNTSQTQTCAAVTKTGARCRVAAKVGGLCVRHSSELGK